jgi:excisionase family DNA binding protein
MDALPITWMSVSETAEYLRVARRTILLWAKRGHLPAHPLHGGKRVTWRFSRSELDVFLMGKGASS